MSKKKFFGCIGNPPYQDDTIGDNTSYAPPLYHTMISAACNIAERVEMITPARFLFNAGSTPKAWNEQMLNDPHFKVMDYEPNSSKVFPNIEIKGGVAVTYHDETKTYEPIVAFVPFAELKTALSKVIGHIDNGNLSEIVSGRSVYRLSQKAIDELPEIADRQSRGHATDIGSSAFKRLTDIVFFSEKPDDGYEYVKILGLANKERTYMWMRRDYINSPDSFYHYKVFIPKANGSGAIGEVLSTPLVGTPLVGATDTFISIGCFDTQNEAENCLKYIKTKFARAMLGTLKVTPVNARNTWKYVPLQDFTSASDIDWTKPVPDIDSQLYEKYGLSDDEISFIEEKVKSME